MPGESDILIRPMCEAEIPAVCRLLRRCYEYVGRREELTRRHRQFWVFRSNQRRFCGDFVVVDMSAPKPWHRPVWVVDLKHNGKLHLGGGGAGVQLRNRQLAVKELAARGVAGEHTEAYAVVGGREVVVRHILAPGGALATGT